MIIFILVLSRSSYTFANVNCLVIISYIRDNPLSSCYFFCLSSVLHEIHTNWRKKSIGRHALPATWCTNCLNRLMFFLLEIRLCGWFCIDDVFCVFVSFWRIKRHWNYFYYCQSICFIQGRNYHWGRRGKCLVWFPG